MLEAARTSARTVRALSGPDRYHLYLIAFSTGFRASELAALKPENFDPADGSPAVALGGKVAKNRKTARQPLHPTVAAALRAYLPSKPAGKPVWPGKWTKHAAKMLRVDLATAGVPYAIEGVNGKEYADFHALRHTFVSALASSGTGAKELQTLARHSDPRLTLGLYTHARSAELVKAVGRLRVPGSAPASSPLAALDRDELEQVIFELCLMLGAVLNTPAGSAPAPGAPLVAPRVALAAGISGNSVEHLDTN